MTTQEDKAQKRAGKTSFGRTVMLAYFGMFGIASDHVNRIVHLDTLVKIFVHRGERIEKRALNLVRSQESTVH